MSQDKAILTAMTQHSSYLYRASTGAVNKILELFDKESNGALKEIRSVFEDLSEAERTAFSGGKYTTPRLKKLKEFFSEWQKTLDEILIAEFAESGAALASYESAYVAGLANEDVALDGEQIYNDVVSKPMTGGALVSELFSGLAYSTIDDTRKVIREGIQNGWTNQQIWRAIRGANPTEPQDGVLRKQRIEAERIIRTARMQISNDAYIETYKAIGFTHVKVVATLDGRTCTVCANYDGKVYAIDDPKKPSFPKHPNSRTVMVGCDADGQTIGRRPYVADERKVKDIPKEQRDGIIGQVNSNTTFKTWFDSQSEEFQQDWLGKTKYELYKKGDYKLDRFVDPLGKPYTIAQLREMDKKTFKALGL